MTSLAPFAAIILVGLGALIMVLTKGRRCERQASLPAASFSRGEGWQLQWSQGASIQGDVLQIPAPPGVVGTITKRMSLAGKSKIRLRFSLDRPVTAQELPESPATISLFFQRAGDDWSARDEKEAFRWYASPATIALMPGEHTIEYRLDQLWTAVLASTSESNPGMFEAAIRESERAGFVLGGASGLAHGVQGPATFTILEWTVE